MHGITSTTIDRLFPDPSPPPGPCCPRRWPGGGLEASAAVRRVLKQNHEKWPTFSSKDSLSNHNHISHHVLALYALGASAPIIEAANKNESSFEIALFKSPTAIDASNFSDHLGDENYYEAYLTFFTNLLLERGPTPILEEYIFSEKSNFDAEKDAEGRVQPEMLNRFVAGLLNPMSHVGYGLEFGLLGVVAEGLAQTAIHQRDSSGLFLPTFFSTSILEAVESATSRFANLLLRTKIGSAITRPVVPSADLRPHALSILARVLSDPRFDEVQRPQVLSRTYPDCIRRYSREIRAYAEMWMVNFLYPNEVERKIEELIWMNTIIYSVCGWKEGRAFRPDFFTLHLIASVIFLPSIVAFLSPHAQALLLRAYFAVSLSTWISRGRPSFPIRSFYLYAPTHPKPPGPFPDPAETTLPGPSHAHALVPSAWLALVQSALVHADDRVPRVLRALAHGDATYGMRAPGFLAGTELPGAELLDGSLFVRAAVLTVDAMGWMREGQERGAASTEGFYGE